MTKLGVAARDVISAAPHEFESGSEIRFGVPLSNYDAKGLKSPRHFVEDLFIQRKPLRCPSLKYQMYDLISCFRFQSRLGTASAISWPINRDDRKRWTVDR